MRAIRRRVSLGALRGLATRPSLWPRLPRYARDLATYLRLGGGGTAGVRLYPCLEDATPGQPFNRAYFYQDTWAARQVFREDPEWMVDLGSTVLLVGILSQHTRCVSVDIRPLDAKLPGLETREGTAVALPFRDAEVPCLTTMCVLEHIGLGRYGDPLLADGWAAAAREIARVVRPGGLVVYSVPVGPSRLEFNAHRRFSPEEAKALFPGWKVEDGTYLVPEPVSELPAAALRGEVDAVGCFAVRKPAAQ